MTKLPEWANWLARDKDKTLVAYRFEPIKVIVIDGWGIKFNPETSLSFKELLSQPIKETGDTFSHIKWTDEEPTEVKRGLETGGVSVEEYERITNAKAHGYDEVPEVADKDGVEIAVGEITSISFEKAMALVENRMEDIQYDWLAENRMVNEADEIADKRYETPDIINEPNHYKGKHGIETIDVIRNFGSDDMVAGFYWGNAIKYMTRYRSKNGLEDLKKARKNIDWLIEHTEG